jgi:hypothetical protein
VAAEIIDVPGPLPFQVVHDPNDDPIVAAAVYRRVEALCTRDRHLRRQPTMAYLALFDIRVLTDVELLTELELDAEGSTRPP